MAEPKHVVLEWRHDLVFEGGAAGKPLSMLLDGGAAEGASPMDALLLALAGCTGSDVVSILKKKRADLRACRVEVVGERRDEHPKRYTAITLRFHITAPGLGEEHARRAIDLSLEKYCSVTHSLAKDIALRYELLLEA
jgi:putative redox protein